MAWLSRVRVILNLRNFQTTLLFSDREKAPNYEIPSSFWINARGLWAEFKKIIGHFEGNLISFKIIKIMLYKI